jgi:hypothetical protein
MPVTLRELAPGFKGFDCSRLRAALSPEACRDNYVGRRCLACRGCPTGAELAGSAPEKTPGRAVFRIAARSTNRALATCVAQRCIRCDQPATRLIGHSICIGCYNRQHELAAGRNGKGKFPTRTAARIRPFCALISAPIDRVEALLARRPSIYEIQRYGDGILWVCGHSIGTDELARFIERFLPGGAVLDFEAQPAVPEAA